MIKDYLDHFDNYEDYAGISFSDYLEVVRSLPGCSKIQNHAINHRLNQEFHKFFGPVREPPVIRIPIPDRKTVTTYKISENLLSEGAGGDERKVAKLMLDILSLYFYFREKGSVELIENCRKMMEDPITNEERIISFLKEQTAHDDARRFEISAFVILQAWYATERIFIGSDSSNVKEIPLRLYKTGRVSANDGGINFVLVPLGKFFQASQSFDLTKFFLDIDKISRFPITFVVQTRMSSEEALRLIQKKAKQEYKHEETSKQYLSSIEGIFTLQDLGRILDELKSLPETQKVKTYRELLDEFIRQYSVEYNIF